MDLQTIDKRLLAFVRKLKKAGAKDADISRCMVGAGINVFHQLYGAAATERELISLLGIIRAGGMVRVATLGDVKPQGSA